jgi:hypothetical protein
VDSFQPSIGSTNHYLPFFLVKRHKKRNIIKPVRPSIPLGLGANGFIEFFNFIQSIKSEESEYFMEKMWGMISWGERE